MAGILPPLAIQLIFLLLYAACGVAMIIKLRGAPAILGGIGWSLLSLVMVFRIVGFGPYFGWSSLISMLGLVCIMIGLFLVKIAPPSPAPEARTVRGAPRIRPHHRPGWGLVAAWITVSAVSWIAGIVALAVVVEAGSRYSNDEEIAIAISLGFAFLLTIAAAVLYLTWLYQAWSAVPEDCRSATPGQAIGFLFIPFFNFYWIFRAVPGLSASIRRAREDYDLDQPGSTSFGWGVAGCVLGIIPYVGILAYFPFLVWVILVNGEKNRMLESIEQAFAEEE